MGTASAAAVMQWGSSAKLAILDLDGTLYAGTLGIDLLNELTRQKLFQPKAFEKALQVMEAYVCGELGREELAVHIYRLYGEGIVGLTQEQVVRAAAEVWEHSKHRVFPFVGELLSTLSRRGYTTVLMTGSPTEIVSQFTRSYVFDRVYAAGFQLQEGRYTGRLQSSPAVAGQKRSMLQRISRELEADLSASLVLGDSENDFEMFDLVGVPIAMNLQGALSLQFQSRGWKQASPNTLMPLVRQCLH
jgi:alcohol-forming fatty acyl-CoA reductase